MPSEDRRLRRHTSGIIRRKARTFYLASLFLPASIRRDVHTVYAYYRSVDDLVDEPPAGASRGDILAELDRWSSVILGISSPQQPLAAELMRVVDRYKIPSSFLLMMLEGACLDLELTYLESREELLRYSILVAGSVGQVMSHILGATDEEALHSAQCLGVAMQLTNVLRDVGEDLERGRVYLPLHDLESAGCTLNHVFARTPTPGLITVMQDVANEARLLYTIGIEGIRYLDRSAQFPIYLAATLYAHILDKIEQQDFDVFARRAHLGTLEKWRLALPAYMHHRQIAFGR